MGKLHVTGFTAQNQESISIPNSLKTIEASLKPEHIIISLNLQTVQRPVRLTHLKNSHRDFLKTPVPKPQMVEQLHLRILQRITINLRKQRNTHLRRIHRANLNLRAAAALTGDIPGTFYDILISKHMNCPGLRGNPSSPEKPPGVLLHRLQERLTHRIQKQHLPPFSDTQKAPAVF